MNKNPFVPTPAYNPQQPPLPPGPPPPQPAQPDYSAYWAAAATAAQHVQAPTVGTYNPQWSASQPARPTPEQSALYANYGYGGQNLSWQQQQQRQAQPHFQPPPPVVQPPPPPPQPAYNPYQPQAGAYQQPYVPQAGPTTQQVPQTQYQPHVAPPQSFQQHQQPYFHPQQQQPRLDNRVHQTSPQQFPPAKRQRFDGPSQHRGPPPPQPQFQPPPPPPPLQQGGSFGSGPGHHGRGSGPSLGQLSMGAGRGSFNGGRGGNNAGGRGRGSPMGMNRGGNRGRGSATYNNMGGRGGGVGQGGGSFRGHGSNRGFGNRDNRRGGSFNAGGGQGYSHGYQQQHHHHQQQPYSGSFRGRGYSHSGRGGRHDAGAIHLPKENGSAMSSGFSSGKKDENRRTLTDFKIVGLEIKELGWSWGPPSSELVEPVTKAENPPAVSFPDVQASDAASASASAKAGGAVGTADAAAVESTSAEAVPASESITAPPPVSRIRIYFHTPVTADDARLVTSQSSFSVGARKRKKLEDDDGDVEDGRGPPPPPPGAEHDGANVVAGMEYDESEPAAGRDSVAPSVAETASEDWLKASFDDDGDDPTTGEGGGEFGHGYDDMHDAQGDVDEHYESALNADGVHSAEGLPLSGPADVSPAHAAHDQENGLPADANSEAGHEAGSKSLPDTNSSSPPPESSSVDIYVDQPSVAAPPATEITNGTSVVDAQATGETSSHTPQAIASLATIPETDPQDFSSTSFATAIDDDTATEVAEEEFVMEATQPAFDDLAQFEHPIPEEPVSPVSHTPVSGSYAPSTVQSEPSQTQQKSDVKSVKAASANRLSISFAATRRLVIDAEIVDKLKVFRAEGRIEVHMNVERDDTGGFKGILIEGSSEDSYITLEPPEDYEADLTVPPFTKIALPAKVVLIGYLDRERPLSEARWVKTGDVQEWLRSIFGRMFWAAGDAADGWEKKIEVVDPDTPPTIWTVLETWANGSSTGVLNERQRFLRTHMTETDNILEILLRLVRGERSTYNQNAPTISAPSVSGPLLSALSQGSAHGAQQTHVSLAVLAIFRLTVEYAKKASPETGKGEAEARVGEIIRCLPAHLIHKSLDGIFKEWKVEKKGGR